VLWTLPDDQATQDGKGHTDLLRDNLLQSYIQADARKREKVNGMEQIVSVSVALTRMSPELQNATCIGPFLTLLLWWKWGKVRRR